MLQADDEGERVDVQQVRTEEAHVSKALCP